MKNRKYLLVGATWSTLFGARKSRVGLAFGDWLAKYTAFLVRQSIYRTLKLSKFWFADVAPWTAVAPSCA